MRSRLSGLAGSRAAMMSDQIVVGKERPGPPIEVSKRAMESMEYIAAIRAKCLNRSRGLAREGADGHGIRDGPEDEHAPHGDPARSLAPDPGRDTGRIP